MIPAQAHISHTLANFHSDCKLYACVSVAHCAANFAAVVNLGYLLAIFAACVATVVPHRADQASHAVAAVARLEVAISQANSPHLNHKDDGLPHVTSCATCGSCSLVAQAILNGLVS